MPSAYDREIYSRTFARLLNQGLKRGNGDARLALLWLEKKYRLLPALLFSRHRPEVSDAYLDVREHFLKRIKESEEMKENGD